MTDVPKIEEILAEIEGLEGVAEAFLVSRSGMYLAGNLPSQVDTDTYASMFAVLLGSADTATSQLGETMEGVAVYLPEAKLVVFPTGSKALFVLRVHHRIRIRRLHQSLQEYADRLQEFL